MGAKSDAGDYHSPTSRGNQSGSKKLPAAFVREEVSAWTLS